MIWYDGLHLSYEEKVPQKSQCCNVKGWKQTNDFVGALQDFSYQDLLQLLENVTHLTRLVYQLE